MQGLTVVYYSDWYGNSKEDKFSCIIFIECCIYTSMAWIQNMHYVTINLCSTYVNEMSIKCLNKYLSRNLLQESITTNKMKNLMLEIKCFGNLWFNWKWIDSTFVAKSGFFTCNNQSKKLQIFSKLKMCDKVLFSIYTLKQKWSS